MLVNVNKYKGAIGSSAMKRHGVIVQYRKVKNDIRRKNNCVGVEHFHT